MRNYLVQALFILIGSCAYGQFIINENFKSSTLSSNIILGDAATLTAGKSDPEGDGWLRLTTAESSKKGYAYINQSFSSALGIIAEFEYKAWRATQNANYTGGDGFSVFLFNGNVTPATFRLGGYGGSLGYVRNTAASPAINNGLFGGYIGIGIDSYGNFGNTAEGKSGLLTDNTISVPRDANNESTIPNTIVLRGATNETTPTLSNQILAYNKLGDRTGNGNAIRLRSELDYDVLTSTRPTDQTFYRKIKIEVKPITGQTKYQVKIYLAKTVNAVYDATPLISYTTEQPIPQTLKIGFAASTGGAWNNHDIRNLQITTTGNLSVFNTVDTPLVCNEKQTQDVTFRVDINNSNATTLNSIQVDGNFLDKVGGQLINTNLFSITSITYSANITNQNIQNLGNSFKGTLSLPPDSSGNIYIKGTIKKPNIQVVNTVNVSASEIVDTDLSNNTSTETVKRYQCQVVTNPMLYIKGK